jgi:spore coat protein U-like protein
MKKSMLMCAIAAAGLLGHTTAFAQIVQPVTLNVALQVEDGCNLNGDGKGGAVTALLNFGTVRNPAGTTVDVLGSTSAAAGGTPFTIRCNVALGQVVASVSGGANDQGGQRRLRNGTNFIGYDLYSDVSRSSSSLYALNTPQQILGSTTAGTVITVTVFGAINAQTSGLQAAAAGSYSDTTTMAITF